MIAFGRFEIRRTLRDSRFILFLVAMPALLYLLLAGFTDSGRQDGLTAPTAFMVAIMCYAAIGSACYAIGPPLAAERARGWIRQLQIMPLAGASWLAVKLIQGALPPPCRRRAPLPPARRPGTRRSSRPQPQLGGNRRARRLDPRRRRRRTGSAPPRRQRMTPRPPMKRALPAQPGSRRYGCQASGTPATLI
jgi:hypothetical protein